MRKLMFLLAMAASFLVASGQAPAHSVAQGWDRVQSLPPATTLHVSTSTHRITCALKTADADGLTCLRPGQSVVDTVARADVRSIKLPRHGRSAIAGGGIGLVTGAVSGALIGAATAGKTSSYDVISTGQVAAVSSLIFGIAFTLVGAVVGYFTDFTATTIYKR